MYQTKEQGPDPIQPLLREVEKEDVQARSSVRAVVVHEAIRQEGEDELARPTSALAWSGLAAGLSMGFSLVTEGLLRTYLPEASWSPLVTKLGYTVGFLVVILGRQQLFTENTLTVILPLLTRRNVATLANVLRLWAVVLAANLAGALLFARVLVGTDLFRPEARQAFADIGREAMAGDFWLILLRGIFAGWLIALMVWMLPAAEASKVWVIVIITYLVGLGGFTHVVAGSVEAMFAVFSGESSWAAYLLACMVPTLAGNIIGGVSLVAALNHAQVVAE